MAIGRQVPVIPIRLGTDPYGFVGKYQAVAGAGKIAKILTKEVYDLLWRNSSVTIRLTESLIARFEASESYDQANTLMQIIEKRITSASPEMIERIEKAPRNNSQVRDAFEVQAKLSQTIRRLRGTPKSPESVADSEFPF